ncbi:MAG: LamG domain-containing protein [Spirochaetes bacterium]|nr:LamG domain-containing protein [Spirochaetota bacterium]
MTVRRCLGMMLPLSAAVVVAIPLLLGGCAGTGNESGNGFDPTAGLIHYYPFSGDATDACDGPKNGTVDGALLTADRHYSEDSTYSFDGDDRIFLDYFPVPDTFTISAWIKTAETSGNIILWREVPTGLGTDGEVFSVYEGHISFSESNGMAGDSIDGETNIAGDTWTHVAAVKSGDMLTLYVDGVYETDNALSSMDLILNELTLGHQFTGIIDEVRVYDRALGQNEIQQLAAM